MTDTTELSNARAETTPMNNTKDYVAAIKNVAMVPKILAAAELLHSLGLQEELPQVTVRKYVKAHPEIQAMLDAVDEKLRP